MVMTTRVNCASSCMLLSNPLQKKRPFVKASSTFRNLTQSHASEVRCRTLFMLIAHARVDLSGGCPLQRAVLVPQPDRMIDVRGL